jgi:glycine hydroxymethyltransferase
MLGVKTIVFVCTGNICRSPMAEGLFHHLNPDKKQWTAESAGIAATPGQPPSDHSVTVMKELAIDISGQRSQALTSELVDRAYQLVVMTYGHLDAILMHFPAASDKVVLLRQFAYPEGGERPLNLNLSDPIGQSVEVYRQCREQIREAMPGYVQSLTGK